MKMDSDSHQQMDLRRFTLDDFRSSDAAMNRCLQMARVASQTDLPILILGESGTGKTLLSHAIHNSSNRAKGPFISFNAAALSDTLLDSQLFGHEKGAFTDAIKRVKGKFELAHNGTLFIDEIADMSSAAQAKILRAVEYGEFERLGSSELHVADVRLISATHVPLHQFQNSETFRKDLFYRLTGITLMIPPLRERTADLPSLIGSEILMASHRQGKSIIGMNHEAVHLLLSYHWPGNLRELSRVIHVAVAMTSENTIPVDAILTNISQSQPSVTPVNVHPVLSEDLSLKTAEQNHIRKVLEQTQGNKRRAAKLLGISRSTLDRKLLSE